MIEPEWKLFKDRPGLLFDDWEVFPKSPWNYALEIDREHPERSITFEPRKPGGPSVYGFRCADCGQGQGPPPTRLETGTRSCCSTPNQPSRRAKSRSRN